MSTKKNRIKLTVTLLLAFVALMAGLFVSQFVPAKKQIDVSQLHGTLLNKPRDLSHFSLMGIDKQSFNNASLQGQWTMVFFGFTNCGYLCPTTMAELNKMYRLLEEKGITSLPRIVMVSVDPDRDSLDKLDHYVKAFNPHFYAARGEDREVRALAQELGIAYAKVTLPKAEDSKNYDVEHSGAVMLFNPQGKLSAFFTTPHQASLLASDYEIIVS